MPPLSTTFTVGLALVLAALVGALLTSQIECLGMDQACGATKQQSWVLVAMVGVVGVALVALSAKRTAP